MKFLRQNLAGLLAVILIYFYFLEFSQFTLLHLLEARIDSEWSVKAVLGGMALAGIVGSVLAWMAGRAGLARRFFGPGFLACGLVALASPLVSGMAAFLVLSVVMGLAVGFLTVSTAALLPALLPGARRGLMVGLGTGLAYAACNLPLLFHAKPETRALVAGGIVLPGSLPFLPWMTSERRKPLPGDGQTEFLKGRWHWLVGAFVVLIWLDSALFYIIQETPSLKEISWAGEGRAWLNGLVHLGAAVLAGWILDRGRLLLPLVLAWLALAAGACGLQYAGRAEFALLYVTGVSLYSCALVFLPSHGFQSAGDPLAFRRAMLVYALAGWIGSGLGIGMGENLNRIPLAFIAVSLVVLLPVLKLSLARS